MILVVSSKNSYAAKRLAEEAKNLGYKLDITEAENIDPSGIDPVEYSCLYIRNPYYQGSPKYLPQIIKLAKKFRASGTRVVDNNIADGRIGQGKAVDYQILHKAGLPIPNDAFSHGREKRHPLFPLVAKWVYGLAGQHVFVVKNQGQLNVLSQKYPIDELILQDLIIADYEYKVITVGYKSLPVVLRFKMKSGGFRIDHSSYEVLNTTHAPQIVDVAERSAKILGRELAKIDILQKGDDVYILEVNRFPGLSSFEQLTKYNVFKEFLVYLKTSLPLQK